MPAFLYAHHYLSAFSVVLVIACLERPPGTPEPSVAPVSAESQSPPDANGTDAGTMDDAERARTKAAAEAATRVVANDGKDPTGGSFTLAEATAGLYGAGAL